MCSFDKQLHISCRQCARTHKDEYDNITVFDIVKFLLSIDLTKKNNIEIDTEKCLINIVLVEEMINLFGEVRAT